MEKATNGHRLKVNGQFKFVIFLLLFLAPGVWAQKVINFEDALKIAKENSPGIRTAKLNLERNRQLLNAQNAALKSSFSLSVEPFNYSNTRTFQQLVGGYNTAEQFTSGGTLTISQPILLTDATLSLQNAFDYKDARSEFGGNQRNRSYENNLYLTLNQPLFTYNRTQLQLENVKTDLENAYLNYVIQELALEQQVAQYFYQAYRAKLALQVASEEQANSEQSQEIIQNKVNAGLAAQEELYQAELNLLTSKSTVQNDEVTLQNAFDDLKKVIGMDIDEDISVVAEIEQTKVQIDRERAIKLGLANRMELRQRQLDIRNSKANLVVAQATNEFKGNVNLVLGIIGDNEKFQNVYKNRSQNQQVSLSFDIPIYDWGEQASREKAAQASVASSQLNLEEEKKDIVIEIRKTYRELTNLGLQIDLARQNLKIAQQTYDLNLERYKNGDLTSMDLNLYQNQLSEKKNGLVDALINYKLTLLDLKVQTLWDFEKDQSVDIEKNETDE